jgi:hypothetical protein
MKNKKVIFKQLFYLVAYWFLFIMLPGCIMFAYRGDEYNFSGLIALFILFISPLFFVIPYKLSGLESKKWKLIYILLGLIFPYVMIYCYLFLSFQRDFNPEIL